MNFDAPAGVINIDGNDLAQNRVQEEFRLIGLIHKSPGHTVATAIKYLGEPTGSQVDILINRRGQYRPTPMQAVKVGVVRPTPKKANP